MKNLIPWSMTIGRVLFAPLVIWLAFHGGAGWMIAACIVAEVVLDIFDGMVARRLGVATPFLRRIDSVVDTIFYLAILYCAWALHDDALRQRWWLLATLLCLEGFRYLSIILSSTGKPHTTCGARRHGDSFSVPQ
jgi:phosphatidylglycerophosphate synthase